jgi:uroporphyrinogen decarboxylase
MMESRPSELHTLLDKLTDMTVDYLALQIEAGVDGVQLFESVGDLLSEAEYREFAHPYHERIFARLGDRAS